MGTYIYSLTDEELKNIRKGEGNICRVLKQINPEEYILELDFSHAVMPLIQTTIYILKQAAEISLLKIIISGHKYKKQLIEQPTVESLIGSNRLEII